MKEKTADEMLDELGYYKFLYQSEDNFLCFRNDKAYLTKFIVFDLKEKNYYYQYGYGKLPTKVLTTIEEYKAITKQMEELGWL